MAGSDDQADDLIRRHVASNCPNFDGPVEQRIHALHQVVEEIGTASLEVDPSGAERLEEIALGRRLASELLQKREKSLTWILRNLELLRRCEQLRNAIHHDRLEQCLFVGKVPVKGANTKARALSNRIDRHPNAFSGEHLLRCLQNPLTILDRVGSHRPWLFLHATWGTNFLVSAIRVSKSDGIQRRISRHLKLAPEVALTNGTIVPYSISKRNHRSDYRAAAYALATVRCDKAPRPNSQNAIESSKEALMTDTKTEFIGSTATEEPDPRRWWSLAVIALSQLMIVLDASVVIVTLPSAQHALHISTANRQWVLSAYTLAFGSLLLLGGRIADYLGRRRMFVIGLLGFGAASALGGLAQNSAMLFSARALQGAFAAIMAPASLSLLTVTFTEARERAKAFGVYGAVAGSGAAIGLVLGGTLTQLASWRWTLLINTPVAVIAAIGATRLIRESRAETRAGYDIPGAATATGGLFLLVYGFTMAGTHGWGAGITVALLVGAALLLAAFVAIELTTDHPLLPLRVVLDQNRGGSFLASLLVGCALLGTFLFLTYFFQGTLHYTALRTGFAFLPFSGGIILGAGLASRFLPRFGPRPLMVTGLILATGGLVWFTRLGVDSSYVGHVLAPEILVSLGMGLTFVPMSSTALIGVDPKDAGVASALLNTTQQVGGALGTAFLNTVAAAAATTYLATRAKTASVTRVAAVHGYTTAFEVSALLVALAALVAAGFTRASRNEIREETRQVTEASGVETAFAVD